MKNKKIWITILALILAVSVTAGCTSGMDTANHGENWKAESSSAASYANEGYYEPEMDYGVDSSSENMTPSGSAVLPEALQNAKLVYNAHMSMETMEFDATVSKLTELCNEMGAFIQRSELDNAANYRHVYYEIRVPSERYRTFVEQAGGICQLNSFNETVEDISERYFSVETRLESAKQELARLQELMSKAENMEDIITIESYIRDVQYEIDSLSGTLQHYDSLVGYSTVSLNLREVRNLTELEPEKVTFGQRIAEAFRDGSENTVDFFKSLLLGIIRHWVFWLVFVLIVLFIVWIIRRAVKRDAVKRAAMRPDLAYQLTQVQMTPPAAPEDGAKAPENPVSSVTSESSKAKGGAE